MEQQPTPESPGAASSGAATIAPIMATEADVQGWYESDWYPLMLSGNTPAEIGGNVLWMGAKVGKHGGPSTKQEYFNGVVRGLEVLENELFYDLS